jgi:transaldolase
MGVNPLTRRAVFLDRDGVINRAFVRDGRPYPPASPAELEVLPGVAAALNRLRAAGFHLVVVTNQPDVARGVQTPAAVEALHAALMAQLPLDEFRVCYHDNSDHCDCRKPAPGLLLAAARDGGLDLAASFLVGDRWRDIEAGQRAGCQTIFIDYGYSEPQSQAPDARVASLSQAADFILARVHLKRHSDDNYQAEGDTRTNMTETANPPATWLSSGTQEMPAAAAPSLSNLQVKIYADGADLASILALRANPYVAGFTTNPTLMRKAGVADYRAFAHDVLQAIPDRPVSFEVFSDDFTIMERQAFEIASWAKNVYVKIPITNTRREPAQALIRRLTMAGVKINVTALLSLEQVHETVASVIGGAPCFISVFAGRIADTGRDPLPMMAAALGMLKKTPNAQLIWASPRELLNIFQADAVGCHIITVTNDLFKRLSLVGKDLDDYSLETVEMFHADAKHAGYEL